jgi:3-oxoadipate enol-lactonase
MPFAALEGVDLYYEETGEGPAIVFAHGAGGNHLIWYQQVAFFSDRFRCVTFDHRMFGQSIDKSGEGRASFARDLEGLLDHLKIDQAFLVGQSMGGSTVFPFTAANPKRVLKLVMADTVGGINTPEITELREKLRRPALPGEDRGRGGFSPSFKHRNRAAFLLYQQISSLNPPQSESGMAATTPPFTVEQLAAFSTPALFIVGDEDPLAPPALVSAASELIPGSRVEMVRGSGHSVYFEKPDVFNQIVDSFISDGSE